MADLLGYTYMQHALLAVLLGSVASGIVGSLVVSNRLSGLAGSVAHASFGGLGLSTLLGFDPYLGALAVSVASALGIGLVSDAGRGRKDIAMAAFWAVGMAMGLVFIKLSGSYSANLMSWLFGSLLAVSGEDLLFAAGLDVLLLASVVLLWKELTAVSYDPEFSELQGVPVRLVHSVMLILMGLTVVMLMRMTGLIMVIALLTIPAGISLRLTASLRTMMVLASVLTLAFSLAGLVLATLLDLPPGASIILVAGAAYIATLGLRRRL